MRHTPNFDVIVDCLASRFVVRERDREVTAEDRTEVVKLLKEYEWRRDLGSKETA